MDCANVASARVAEKLGYRLERTEQQEKLALGHTGAAYVWQMSRDEWPRR
jgi:RimJ/RimL family protein N-acetyltransferase